MKKALKILAIAFVAVGFSACDNVFKRVSTARSESAATLKAIVQKVFADNIDTTKATAPSGESWGEWIMAIAQLDKARWAISSNGVYPIDRKSKTPCHNSSKTPLIWINSQTGAMHFNPSKLTDSENGFCVELKNSYVTDTGNGDMVVPLLPNDEYSGSTEVSNNSNVAQSSNSGDSSVADSPNDSQSNNSVSNIAEVSGDSVCSSYNIKDLGKNTAKNLARFIDEVQHNYDTNENTVKQLENLVVHYYNGEIKQSDKETICIYMVTIGQDHLNTNLTQQELEQFDRFLVEKLSSSNYAKYENSEEVQDYLLTALKFFKYHNKLDVLYSKKFITIEGNYNDLYKFASTLKFYENNYDMEVKRFIYGKDMGNYFNSGWAIYLWREYLNNSKNPIAIDIAKWAEQKLKEVR